MRVASEQDADLLLTDAPQALIDEGLPPGDLKVVLDQAPCDVAALASSGEADFGHGATGEVIGLSDQWSTESLGEIRRVLAQDAKAPTLLVHRGERPGGLTPPENLTRYTWSRADLA